MYPIPDVPGNTSREMVHVVANQHAQRLRYAPIQASFTYGID